MSIEVKNLYKYYGEQAAVRDVSFSVKKGEIVAFLGPNGAGKSTTMKIMTGFMPASEGEVFICGKKVDIDKLDTRQILGYLPENKPLYTDMYVRLSVYTSPFCGVQITSGVLMGGQSFAFSLDVINTNSTLTADSSNWRYLRDL